MKMANRGFGELSDLRFTWVKVKYIIYGLANNNFSMSDFIA